MPSRLQALLIFMLSMIFAFASVVWYMKGFSYDPENPEVAFITLPEPILIFVTLSTGAYLAGKAGDLYGTQLYTMLMGKPSQH